ncbi:membrane protein [Arthrobacter phage DevitoJr]|uniref:Membrane protein n=2 Tax=Gordonvirus TaxID=1982152 RepID=A0AAE7VHV2_9CAUD|nr:hypothetical protein QCN35_gp63 [Arthrobacter phage Synepsis]YP_010750604.1 membrane protein [Arthrobacter phage DevitoJr]AXH46725.1 hypothetical protein SEA_SYNEPSIS_63 [Arthrobacter phage Synepsis]QXO13224.1 membrane protein [Arthrobacter phage DevitoJr]
MEFAFFNVQVLTWVMSLVGFIGFIFVGQKKWWGWYINLVCQILWATYALVTGQLAFLAFAAAYFVIFARNAFKWTKDELASRKLRNGVSQLQVGETFEHNGVKFTRGAGEDSNLVKHARYELNLIGEEPEVIEWYVRVIKEYASFGHSGGSAWATTSVLEELLHFRPLTEITDDPDEWFHHGEEVAGRPGGLWQSKRDGRCFSTDGGKTYTCVDDDKHGVQKVYTSISKEHWLTDHAHVSQG